jgi:drug/metabolite transporter (DMT)-like permease
MQAMPPRSPVDPLTVLALTVAVFAFSSSAPLIAYAAAPGLAIAFWRNAAATGVLLPAALIRRRGEVWGLVRDRGRRDGLYTVLAGAALAVHFGLWVPSIKLTTVAMGTALVATQPVWQGLIAVGQGKRLPGLTWVGIAVAVAGVALATGADIGTSSRAIIGDLMALAAGVAAAVYVALGEQVRAAISTTTYTAVCYGVCAVLLLAACLTVRAPLHGYPATTWLALLAMTIGPQLLGHSMVNFSLRRVSATTSSMLILLEVPGAALLGWVWLGQAPQPGDLPGLALLVGGVLLVVLANRRTRVLQPAAID